MFPLNVVLVPVIFTLPLLMTTLLVLAMNALDDPLPTLSVPFMVMLVLDTTITFAVPVTPNSILPFATGMSILLVPFAIPSVVLFAKDRLPDPSVIST